MATVNTLERKNNKNESKMHFARTSAVLAMLGTFKLHLKGLGDFFSKFTKKKFTGYFISFYVFWGGYSTYCLKVEVEEKYILIFSIYN